MSGYANILGPVDSAFYYVEQPETPMNIGALTIYDGHVDFQAFVQLIDSRLQLAPRYFQRIVQAPFHLGQPTWITDPSFYLRNHVKRVVLPTPATEEQLRIKVGELLSCTLDRSKPLWEIYLIEGLEKRTAIFFKVHHCMVDGLAAVELFTMLMDLESDVKTPSVKSTLDAPRLPDPARLTFDSFQRDIFHRFNMLDKLGKDISRVTSNLRDSNQRLKMLLGVAHLISNNLKPIRRLPINGVNSGQQMLIWGEFPIDEVHSIRRKVGASVNDVMLSVLTDAVETYCRRRNMNDQEFLRILVPFNVRAEEEIGNYGNRISVLPIDIPFGVAGPIERLQETTKFSKAMKESSLSLTMDMILTLPSLLPAPIQPSVWGMAPLAFSILAHTWCTNVAAPPVPVYLLGHELKHVYGYFPLNPTMGIACVVVSYNGLITMTIVTDQAIVPDPDTLENDLRAAYARLRRASGLPDAEATHSDTQETQLPIQPAVSEAHPESASPPAETAVTAKTEPDEMLAKSIEPADESASE
ncbi:MAG: wax ester/triacylglycerol synthase family O-acyltransferase, partial [Anaerolineae bacterium]|nr:wax ester/triacylglycerol synthase family O-acyltransferase [Anaerolineae bacterium]